MEHSPDLMLRQCAGVSYNPDADSSLYEKFVSEIMEGNADNIKYLQTLKAYILTGYVEMEKIWYYYGCSTRNGKSTDAETFLAMMGSYGIALKPETLAEKWNNDSRVASPDLAALQGKRYGLLPEIKKSMRMDGALTKRITGGNTIRARYLHQNEVEFKLQCKLVCDCNYLPLISDNTLFTSDRCEVIPFNKYFKPEERDVTLKKRLTEPDNLSGLLNWVLHGWSTYCNEGLKRTTTIEMASVDYEQSSDKMANFIADCLEEAPGECVSIKDAYKRYESWCRQSGFGTENKTNFIADIKQKKLFKNTGTINGVTVRNVIPGYKLSDNDFLELSDEDEKFVSEYFG
jgi:putative DNA primase/helicase